jgi:hypothetical protein
MTMKINTDIDVFYCGACRIVIKYDGIFRDRETYSGYISVKQGEKRYKWNFSELGLSPMCTGGPRSVAENAIVFCTCGYNEEGEEVYPPKGIQYIFSGNMNTDEDGEPIITKQNPWRKKGR